MGINNFTISLACRLDRTDNKNEAPLYLTINQGKQRKKISLDCKLNISYWDNQAKTITTECINKEYYDLIIANKKQEINKKIITANIEGRELFLDDFSDNKKKEEKQFIKQHFEKYIQELYAEDRIKNAKYYLCCLNCLMDFTHGVLNAGGQQAAHDIAEITEQQVQRTFEVNVYAPLFMAQAAVPLLPSGASVIITASAEYYTPNKLLLDYAASKSAVTAFGVALSKYLLEKGVRVNSVCPGPTWTPLEVSGGNPDEAIPGHGADTPLQRAAQPAEMAGIYVFLASDEASYITGEIYGITGGLSGK